MHRFLIILVGLATLSLAPVEPAAQAVRSVGRTAGEFVVPLNRSQLLQLDRDFEQVSVGNADIAEVVPLTERTIYVFGRQLGSTNATFVGAQGQILAVVDVVVSHDVQGLKQRLHQLMPNEQIRVRPAGGSVVLSGTVSSASSLANALSVAQQYAPEKVTNLLSVAGSQQVMLHVRFAEVRREVVKNLGFNIDALLDTNNIAVALTSGTGIFSEAFAVGAITGTAGDFTVDAVFDALEEKGLVRTLAEPNLIVLSGATADFLAGGEFPIPVAQDAANANFFSITIEFKEFGVSLAFTPTVLSDDVINLELNTEVSAIDPQTSVRFTNIEVPGLTVRRARTAVEMRDGQSFAIAGLLQDDFRGDMEQLPWLGDIPVLGALFRSADYQRRETELVVIITPRLVQPVVAGTLRSPTDDLELGNDGDVFLKGRFNNINPAARPLASEASGGFDGNHGYILR